MNVYETAKNWLLPGSLSLFFVCLLFCLATVRFSRATRLGMAGLLLIVFSYLMMSVPVGAWLLGRLVSAGYSSPAAPSALTQVQAIVVLDANTIRYGTEELEIIYPSRQTVIRAHEAIRLYRQIKPAWVLVTGGSYVRLGRAAEGEAMRQILLAGGVPADRLLLDSRSRNTREHAVYVPPMLREKGVARIALVTSSMHMRRAMRAFSVTGIQVVPAPAPLDELNFADWRPRTSVLNRSVEAWYEVFALLRDYLR